MNTTKNDFKTTPFLLTFFLLISLSTSSCQKENLLIENTSTQERVLPEPIFNPTPMDGELIDSLLVDWSVQASSHSAMAHQLGFTDTTVMVDVGGYSLFAQTAGTGNKTIVFESGFGEEGYLIWMDEIFEAISENNQVIVYNRAGHPPSEASNNDIPRDINQLAIELKMVIDAMAQNSQVVLVGHSLGGPILRSFANQFPEKVEALVLVDPSHEDEHTAESIQEDEDELMNIIPDFPPYGEMKKEVEQMAENWAIMNALPNLPNVPVTVLTAMSLIDDGEVISEEERQAWYDAHETLGKGVDDFIHLSSDEVGHNIPVEDPWMVIDAIFEILE